MWDTLGIEPTDDVRLIRAAYAQRLRSIDIETEPKAFIALRAAYDGAMDGAHAAGRPLATQNSAVEAPVERWGIVDEPPLPAQSEMAAIQRLLECQTAGDGVEAELSALTVRLVECSRASSIGQSEQIEFWLAATIMEHAPRSEAMLAPAIGGFGWTQRLSDYDCPDSVRDICQFADDYAYLRQLQRYNPDYTVAWAALTGKDVALERVHPGCMTTLLGTVQHSRPFLANFIDLDRFELLLSHVEEARQRERRASIDMAAPPPFKKSMLSIVANTIVNFALMASAIALSLRAIYVATFSFESVPEIIVTFLISSVPAVIMFALGRERQAHLMRQLDRSAYLD